MQEINIILKLNFKGDIRRIRLIDRSFEGLQKQIGNLYGIQEGSFTLKYKDDEGDQVTIASNEELNEAYRSIQRNILRIDITEKQEKEEGGRCGRFRKWREHCKKWKENNQKENDQHPQHPPFNPFGFHPFGFHPHHHFQNPQQQPFNPFGFVQNIAQNLMEQGSPFFENLLNNSDFIQVQHNHICDGCETPIRGSRFHCTECSDFDFCSNCHQTKLKSHPEHKFEEINAFQALKSALSNGELIDAFFEGKGNDVEQPKPQESNIPQQNNTNQEVSQNTLEQQILEQEKIKQKLEQEKLEQEKLEQERLEKEKLQKLEQERLEQQKLEQQKIQQDKLEQQKKEQQKQEQKPSTGFDLFRDILFPLRSSQQSQEPSEKVVYPFEEKLQDLQTMGFTDRKKNILALVQNKGNIQLAIEQLLN